jgi:hypothetical protein
LAVQFDLPRRERSPKMRLWFARTCLVLAVATGAITFARWRESPLHIHVCGPNSELNLRWIFYGSHANDDWPAKLCGCEVPAAFADSTRLRFVDNLGALQFEWELRRNKELRKRFDNFRLGNLSKRSDLVPPPDTRRAATAVPKE